MIALFKAYPDLANNLPYIPLADLPTPVRSMERLSNGFRDTALFLKQDGHTGTLYGGNKVRKLGFLLGEAKQLGAKRVLTFGAAGSNHALATAIYAQQCGLHSISILMPQPRAKAIQRNLLRGFLAEADLQYYPDFEAAQQGAAAQKVHYQALDGVSPYEIPPGGSSPLGAIGFVNAAFELREQIEAGELPQPDFIYAASGTMGTVVGLCLGLRAANLSTRLMAVSVTEPPYSSRAQARTLFEQVNARLHAADPTFPLFDFPEEQFCLRDEFLGPGYAVYTPEGQEAVKQAQTQEGLRLENVYTGKAFAALLADAASGVLENKTALFWNTYNARDFSDVITDLDYHRLPKKFHCYFEEPLQQ